MCFGGLRRLADGAGCACEACSARRGRDEIEISQQAPGAQQHGMLTRCGGALLWGEATTPRNEVLGVCAEDLSSRTTIGDAPLVSPLQLHLSGSSTLQQHSTAVRKDQSTGKVRRRAWGGGASYASPGYLLYRGRSDMDWRWRGCVRSAAVGGGGCLLMAAPGRVAALSASQGAGGTMQNGWAVGDSVRGRGSSHSRCPVSTAGFEEPGAASRRVRVPAEKTCSAGRGELWDSCQVQDMVCLEDLLQRDVASRITINNVTQEPVGGDARRGRRVCVQQVSAGERSALVLLSNGTVLSFGRGYSCGHVGRGAEPLQAPAGLADARLEKPHAAWAGQEGSCVHDLGAESRGAHPLRRPQNIGGTRAVGGAARRCNWLSCRKVPTMMKLLGDEDIAAVSAGDTHALALTRSGGILAWGCNIAGQLGDGSISCSAHPVRVRRCGLSNASDAQQSGGMGCSEIVNRAVKVATGVAHSVAAMEDGSVLTWGCGNCGQLGNGVAAGSWSGLRLHADVVRGLAGVHVVDVAAGAFHTLALSAAGDVYAWGFNAHGQIGDGTTASSSTPRRVLTGALSVAAGYAHSLALSLCNSTRPYATEGSARRCPQGVQVWSWGLNHRGQLGDGTCSSRKSPTLCLAPLSETLASISATVTSDCLPRGAAPARAACVVAAGGPYVCGNFLPATARQNRRAAGGMRLGGCSCERCRFARARGTHRECKMEIPCDDSWWSGWMGSFVDVKSNAFGTELECSAQARCTRHGPDSEGGDHRSRAWNAHAG